MIVRSYYSIYPCCEDGYIHFLVDWFSPVYFPFCILFSVRCILGIPVMPLLDKQHDINVHVFYVYTTPARKAL